LLSQPWKSPLGSPKYGWATALGPSMALTLLWLLPRPGWASKATNAQSSAWNPKAHLTAGADHCAADCGGGEVGGCLTSYKPGSANITHHVCSGDCRPTECSRALTIPFAPKSIAPHPVGIDSNLPFFCTVTRLESSWKDHN
jgi:hypothetical protein